MNHTKEIKYEYNQLIRKIQFTNHCILENWNAFGKQKEITYLQFKLLNILKGSEIPLSTRQLNQKITDNITDTSRLVDRLVQKGLVLKKPSEVDKRLIDVIISEKGLIVLDEFESRTRKLESIVREIPEDELVIVNRFFEKLCNFQG